MKRLLVFITAFIVLFSTFSTVSAAPLFKDVGDTYSAKAELDFLATKGIIKGDPTKNFDVNKEITRLEAAEMIIKSLGLDTTNRSALIFTDITPDHAGYPIIAAIVDEGIMKTDENGAFNPDAPFTRGASAVFLVRAFDFKGTVKTPFVDVLANYWVSESINILQANKIATGYSDNTYKPLANITKVDFAIQLARTLNPDFRKVPFTPIPEAVSCEKPSKTKKVKVNVQVTSLWHKPGIDRAVDRASINKPVDISKWMKSMNLSQK
ncbi:S-layer homology domain-containing protein [Psychrobacillus sp. PGGUH221]|uniref:S-layer homology domain-containing protein n=1 Tax=Psychrobacillus sp. PGGUH221 TaxID=3020058 RepID=UPI0035C6710D